MGTMTDNPDQRVGFAERDAAVARLHDSYVAGRLTVEEYAEREAAARDAVHQRDIDALLADLPPVVGTPQFEIYPHQSLEPFERPAPRNLPVPYDPQARVNRREPNPAAAPTGFIVSLVIFIGLWWATGSFPWYMFFFIGPLLGSMGNNYRRRRRP